jgi:mevalonate kinase
MDASHVILKEIGVSSPALDDLVQAAHEAGAWGAKLSGAGRGGTMLALVPEARIGQVQQALTAAGAVRTIYSQVGS